MASALAAAILAVALGSQPAVSSDRAAIRISSLTPLVVRASLFEAGERVVVVANVKGGTRRKVVYASARGTFVVMFSGVRLANCDTFVIRATGSRGSYGMVRSARECAPIAPVGP